MNVRTGAKLHRGLAILVIALSALARPAEAQTKGFALDRFEPSAKGSLWFALDSLDFRGTGRPAVGIVADYGYKPLVVYDSAGNEKGALVSHQLFVHLGGSVTLFDRLRFAANLPVAVYQDGDGGTLGGVSYPPPSSTSLGDLRLDADARLFGEHGGPLTLALGVQTYLPTGERTSYSSDGSVRVTPHFLAAGELGPLVYAVSLGFMLHAQEDAFAGNAMGQELVLGGAAGLLLADKRLLIGPELVGRTDVTDSGSAFAKHQSPLEALVGVHATIATGLRLGAGAGTGLTQGFGSPALRLLASMEWAPDAEPPPPRDRDGDRVLDSTDACPDTPGVRTVDPRTNGCPVAAALPRADRDGDGAPDADDACPDAPGVRTSDPKTNGCPSDGDGDGIIDAEDACPDTPGIHTGNPKTNGCPAPDGDRDKDGIPNELDACPDQAGPSNPDPKKNGCPQALVEQGQIKILDQVKFKTESEEILKESDGTLAAVLKVLAEHPEIVKVSVEGHTDNRGRAAYNKALSERRAASVVKWLTSRGVDRSRLASIGYGQERPIDVNSTEAGRRNNRRVEFHIVEGAR